MVAVLLTLLRCLTLLLVYPRLRRIGQFNVRDVTVNEFTEVFADVLELALRENLNDSSVVLNVNASRYLTQIDPWLVHSSLFQLEVLP